MEIKKRPLQAVNQDISLPDNIASHERISPSKHTLQKHRAHVYRLQARVKRWTEIDILRYFCISSYKNYASALERTENITFEHIDEKIPDSIGGHPRYHIVCRSDAQCVNHNAVINGHTGLSLQEIADILSLYPDNQTAA